MATNPSLYNVNYNGVAANLTPPNHRTPVLLTWLNGLLAPLQWVHDAIYTNFANGSNCSLWSSSSEYVVTNRVIDPFNNSVYECINNSSNPQPYTDTTNTYWVMVCNDFRGARARAIYNSQHLTLEWILNEWFHTTFRQPQYTSGWQRSQFPDIYIQNNAFQNSVFTTYNEDTLASLTYNGDYAADFVFNTYTFDIAGFTIYVPNSTSSPNHNFYNTLCATIPSPLDTIYIDTAGSNYTSPTVTISAPGTSGSITATATAVAVDGKISYLQLTNPGSGYIAQPTVTIMDGGSGSGATATAMVLIADDQVRGIANQYVVAGVTYDIKTY